MLLTLNNNDGFERFVSCADGAGLLISSASYKVRNQQQNAGSFSRRIHIYRRFQVDNNKQK